MDEQSHLPGLSEGRLRVGFTGTRSGMTPAQRERVTGLLQELAAERVHHGDCVGADADVHDIARELGIPVVLHPPSDPKARAHCTGSVEERPARPYLQRNRHIVDETEVLIATPYGAEQRRSGTWSTVRYARKRARRCYIVTRDGALS